MKAFFSVLIILWCAIGIGQGVLIDQVESESIEVQFDEFENPIVYHTLAAGNSIYKITKLFHAPVDLVLDYNDLQKADEIPVGTRIKVPVDFAFTYRGESINGYKNTRFIPLIYKVKAKENLFRIAKVYCGESIKEMMKRNKLTSKNLNIGQELILGWLPIDSKSVKFYSNHANQEKNPLPTLVKVSGVEEYVIMVNEDKENVEVSTNSQDVEDGLDTLSVSNSDNLNIKQTSGIAIWTKTSKGHSLYVLHPTAKINSEIELFNPLVNRSVRAKVIGRIPAGAYTDDVSVIISPATAVSLGALDSRFKVIMKFVE